MSGIAYIYFQFNVWKGEYNLRKNKILVIIIFFLATIILMAVGYSTFATDLLLMELPKLLVSGMLE